MVVSTLSTSVNSCDQFIHVIPICFTDTRTSVTNQFLILGSIIGLKFRSINQIESVLKCYQVEAYTAIHIIFNLQTNFKQTHIFDKAYKCNVDLPIIHPEIQEDLELKSLTFNVKF